MNKISLFIILTFSVICSFAQENFNNEGPLRIITMYEECKCNEVVIVSENIEKGYSGDWLLHMNAKHGFLEFSKGTHTHHWNVNDILYIEKEKYRLKIYLK